MTTTAIVSPEMLAGLPTPVQRYMNFSGVVGRPLVKSAVVKQTGRIRLGPEKRWMQFRATESYSIDPPSFTWDARVGYGRLSFLAVRDSYIDGKGAVRVRLANLFQLLKPVPRWITPASFDFSVRLCGSLQLFWGRTSTGLQSTSLRRKCPSPLLADPFPADFILRQMAGRQTSSPDVTKTFAILSRCFGRLRPPPMGAFAVLTYQIEARQSGILSREISPTSRSRLRRSDTTRGTHDHQVPQNAGLVLTVACWL